MEELIHRNFKGASQLFKRIYRWNRVIVLDSRNVTPKQTGSLLDVSLDNSLASRNSLKRSPMTMIRSVCRFQLSYISTIITRGSSFS